MLAHSLTARAFAEGMNNSTNSPASGVNRTIDRIWSISRCSGIAPHGNTEDQLEAMRIGGAMRANYRGGVSGGPCPKPGVVPGAVGCAPKGDVPNGEDPNGLVG